MELVFDPVALSDATFGVDFLPLPMLISILTIPFKVVRIALDHAAVAVLVVVFPLAFVHPGVEVPAAEAVSFALLIHLPIIFRTNKINAKFDFEAFIYFKILSC